MPNYKTIASTIVNGSGVTRTRSCIIEEVQRALEKAHADGFTRGREAAQASAARQVAYTLESAHALLGQALERARKEGPNP